MVPREQEIRELRKIVLRIQELEHEHGHACLYTTWKAAQEEMKRLMNKVSYFEENENTEDINQHIEESLHCATVGEIVGEEFEGVLTKVDVEIILRRVLHDFHFVYKITRR